ncbi:MAG: ATP-binding cassette, subfamily bacterial [Actinomycetota bacterium]|jgi:ATP-binding cassette subfamily B protein
MLNHLRTARLIAGIPFRVSRWRPLVAIATLVVSQASAVATAVFLKLLVDATLRHDRHGVVVAAGLLAATVAINLAGAWLSFSVRVGMTERASLVLDSDLALLAASAEGIEHFERPEYLDRIELLRQEHQNLASMPDSAAWTIALLLRLIATVAALASITPALALLPVFALPSLVTGARTQRRSVRTWADITMMWRQQFDVFQLGSNEAPGRETRVFGMQAGLEARFRGLLAGGDQALGRAARRSAVEESIGWAIFSAAFVGALVVLGQQVINHRATAGDLVLALTLAAQLNNQIALFASSTAAVIRSFGIGEKLLWLMDYATESRAGRPDETGAVPPSLRDGIRFEAVTFRYPGTDRDVLTDVSLQLPAGASIAIVGENGAGKTTIAKLLTGMYQPTSGRITVDGVDLAAFPLDEWRTRTAASFQDHAHFEFLARTAIGTGDLAHLDDLDAIAHATDRADAADLVASLPDGLSTQLGRQFEDGSELSGGQWQKIALARGLMRTAPLLLVLDEPTAALDPQTEARLFDRYVHAASASAAVTGGITILVSHRFSTVRFADLIIVIDGGRVIETGTHEELAGAGGLYAELYALQAASYR